MHGLFIQVALFLLSLTKLIRYLLIRTMRQKQRGLIDRRSSQVACRPMNARAPVFCPPFCRLPKQVVRNPSHNHVFSASANTNNAIAPTLKNEVDLFHHPFTYVFKN